MLHIGKDEKRILPPYISPPSPPRLGRYYCNGPIYYSDGSGSEESLMNNQILSPPSSSYFLNRSSSYQKLHNPHSSQHFHRRFSSSHSSAEDILFAQRQKIHIDPRYRDSRPIANSNNSLNREFILGSNQSIHHWDTNPSIHVEEYTEEQVSEKPNDNTTEEVSHSQEDEMEEPENDFSEENIPFIDDDIEYSGGMDSSVYTPIHPCGILNKRFRDSLGSGGCRKTVSFDLLLQDNDSERSSNICVNKSKTCCELYCNMSNVQTSEPSPKERTRSRITDEDCSSKNGLNIYFESDRNNQYGSLAFDDELLNFDLDEMRLDLSDLSTSPENKIAQDIVKKYASDIECQNERPSFRNYDDIIRSKNKERNNVVRLNRSAEDLLGLSDFRLKNGKTGSVKLLARYFDCLEKDKGNKVGVVSDRSKLRKFIEPDNLSRSQPSLTNHNTPNFSEYESNLILKQLREWSTFGSKSAIDKTTRKVASEPDNDLEIGHLPENTINLKSSTIQIKSPRISLFSLKHIKRRNKDYKNRDNAGSQQD